VQRPAAQALPALLPQHRPPPDERDPLQTIVTRHPYGILLESDLGNERERRLSDAGPKHEVGTRTRGEPADTSCAQAVDDHVVAESV